MTAEHLAARLRLSLIRLQKHIEALEADFGPVEETDFGLVEENGYPQIITMLEQEFRLPQARRQTHKFKEWRFCVGQYSASVLNILQNNGFPRASMKAEDGPAVQVMENLIRSLSGGKYKTVTAKTIAREVVRVKARAAKRDAQQKPQPSR